MNKYSFVTTIWIISVFTINVGGGHVLFTTQAFYLPISRNLFDNFGQDEQVEYRATMLNMPDLPSWMFYRHPNGSEQAYLYGAPEEPGEINVEVIAMNTANYETSRRIVNFHIQPRKKEAHYQVQVKLLNLNVEDMFEMNRLRLVEEIFREHLWRTSASTYVTLVASAVDVGGRRPLNPKDKEGVIIRIGGTDNFTQDLLDLEREVFPLRKRFPCPKDYLRTTAEHLFRKRDLISDWCSFRLIPANQNKKKSSSGRGGSDRDEDDETNNEFFNEDGANNNRMFVEHGLHGRRDLFLDFCFSILAPSILVLLLLVAMTCAFCCHRDNLAASSLIPLGGKSSTLVQMNRYNNSSKVALTQSPTAAEGTVAVQPIPPSTNSRTLPLTFNETPRQRSINNTLPRVTTSATNNCSNTLNKATNDQRCIQSNVHLSIGAPPQPPSYAAPQHRSVVLSNQQSSKEN